MQPRPDSPDLRTTAGRSADLDARLEEARAESSGAESSGAEEEQHAGGTLTARERIERLLDDGSFLELDALARRSSSFGTEQQRPYGDGVITGLGTVDGRQVCVFSHDATVFGGSLGRTFGEKIAKVMDLAMTNGCPLIGINDSGGSRIEEGVVPLGLYGEIFRRHAHASGVIPQISLIMGRCTGDAAFGPAMTDFTVMVDQTSQLYLTDPDVIRTVTGDDVSAEELGGGRAHNATSGNAHYLGSDEDDAIGYVRELLSFLPQNNLAEPPSVEAEIETEITDHDRHLDALVPDSPNQPYDMQDVITTVLDDGELLQTQPLYATNVVTGFGRVEGRSVGIVANQPQVLAGCLDIDAAQKAARFVRTCDGFNIPVITFVDVPGFLPGTDQEWNGVLRRGAGLLFAYAEATVPLVTVITRKAHGGAYAMMGSKHLGADLNLAWPTAQVAVLGAQGAVDILHRDDLADADDPDTRRAELINAYEDETANPYLAAEHGYVDAVIQPHRTRTEIARGLRLLRNKREHLPPKKHGNLPL